jgi:hypothetical protein
VRGPQATSLAHWTVLIKRELRRKGKSGTQGEGREEREGGMQPCDLWWHAFPKLCFLVVEHFDCSNV